MDRRERLHSSAVYDVTTRGYLIALFLVAGLSFLAYLTMHRVIGAHQHRAAVINVSGRQRMLSQRIALFSEALRVSEGRERATTQTELTGLVHEFAAAHASLSTIGPTNDLLSPAIRDVYFSAATHLDEDARRFVGEVERLLNFTDFHSAEARASLAEIRLLSRRIMLPKLDAIVKIHQRESERDVTQLQSIETAILIATWLLLLAEAFFIFRPMARSIATLLRKALLAEAAAQKATEAKSAFLATITHEIRTPIAGVLGITDTLLSGDLGPSQRHQLQIVHRLSDTLVTLVNDLLDYSKIEAGRLELEIVDFAMSSLIEDVEHFFRGPAERKGIRLEILTDSKLPARLRGDPTRIRQVLTNFLGNALKFTPAEGSITVRLRSSETPADAQRIALRVEVADTGAGIPVAAQARLFQRFEQADASTNRTHGGTGLGLAICKQIIDTMQGEIGLESVEGAGSTFWFALRLERGEEKMRVAAETLLPLPRHVLIAEDHPVLRQMVTAQLESLGIRVHGVEDGASAVAAAEGIAFDLILLDGELPILDGFAASSLIHRNAARDGRTVPPILALTGHSGAEVEVRAQRAGMQRVLTKPVRMDRLAESLREALALAAVTPAETKKAAA